MSNKRNQDDNWDYDPRKQIYLNTEVPDKLKCARFDRCEILCVQSANMKALPKGTKTAWCFRNDIRTITRIDGKRSDNVRLIEYLVSARGGTVHTLINRVQSGLHHQGTSQYFEINEKIVEQFRTHMRRHENSSGNYAKADFSALITMLAACVATFCITGELTPNDILGLDPNTRQLNEPNVRTINAAWQPFTLSGTSLFIPRCTGELHAKDTFAAMAVAASSIGCEIYTDWLGVDNLNRPTLYCGTGVYLAINCWRSIEILINIMDLSGCGGMGLYALLKGIHSVMSVHGHSDEGAYIRDVFRSGGFVPSYGVVMNVYEDAKCTKKTYLSKLPSVVGVSEDSLRRCVISIALFSAALVADCDPLMIRANRHYPCVYGTHTNKESDTPLTIDECQRIACAIASDCTRFTNIYIRELSSRFQLSTDKIDHAITHMNDAFSIMVSRGLRHLTKHSVVAPFFWIEPTGLVMHRNELLPAIIHGYGTMCEVQNSRGLQHWDSMSLIEAGGNYSFIGVGCRSARVSGMLVHLDGNFQKGLQAMNISMGETKAFINEGDRNKTGKTLEERTKIFDPIENMLWIRGHNPLPHPAELLYIGEGYAIEIEHYRVGENRTYISNHVYNENEIRRPEPIVMQVGMCWYATQTEAHVIDAQRNSRYNRAAQILENGEMGVSRDIQARLYFSEFVDRDLCRDNNNLDIFVIEENRREMVPITVRNELEVPDTRHLVNTHTQPVAWRDDSKKIQMPNPTRSSGHPIDLLNANPSTTVDNRTPTVTFNQTLVDDSPTIVNRDPDFRLDPRNDGISSSDDEPHDPKKKFGPPV